MFRSQSLFDPFTTPCPSRHSFIPCVTKLLCNSIIPLHPNCMTSTKMWPTVALVLPLPDPQVPEQHEPCCILCKKPSEWKFSSMHHLRCRLHHYYKPKADCILLNRKEWIAMRDEKRESKLGFSCGKNWRWLKGSVWLEANCSFSIMKSHSSWNFQFPR